MPQPTDIIGPYTLIRKLGRGSFGVVWLAEKRGGLVTTEVALKIFYEEELNVEMIRNEASLWLRANGHSNILGFLDADIYDNQPVIISEYAADGTLMDWLASNAGKAPDLESGVQMMIGILRGLEHLHRKGIIHRDLKPQNILLTGDNPRLADFGIARILENTGAYSTRSFGTPMYMAPEAFRGKRNEQTDLWSAGVMFYQILCGVCPFDGTDPVSLMHSICNGQPKPLPSHVSPDLKAVLVKALEKNASERYLSATEMRQAVENALRDRKIGNHVKQPPSPEEGPHETLPGQITITSAISAKETQLQYWTALNSNLRRRNSRVNLKPPKAYFQITGVLGHPQVEIFAVANTRDAKLCVGVRIFNRKDIYDALVKVRDDLQKDLKEMSVAEDLSWNAKKRFHTISEISLCNFQANILWREHWPLYLDWHSHTLEAVFKAFEPRVRAAVKAMASKANISNLELTKKLTSRQRSGVATLQPSRALTPKRELPERKGDDFDSAELESLRRLLGQFSTEDTRIRFCTALCEAGDTGLTNTELAERMNVTQRQAGLAITTLGSLVKRVDLLARKRGSATYVEVLIDASRLSGSVWHYRARPILRAAMKAFQEPNSFSLQTTHVQLATLPPRKCRVQFKLSGRVVHTSPEYTSRNTWAKIIAYARTKRGGAPNNLSPAAIAVPQVLTPEGWRDVKIPNLEFT